MLIKPISSKLNGANRSDLGEQLSRLLQPDRVVPSTDRLSCHAMPCQRKQASKQVQRTGQERKGKENRAKQRSNISEEGKAMGRAVGSYAYYSSVGIQDVSWFGEDEIKIDTFPALLHMSARVFNFSSNAVWEVQLHV